MRSINKFFMVSIFSLALIFLASCNITVLTGLTVIPLENEIEVYEGEDLPLDKFQITAKYSNGSTKEISADDERLGYRFNNSPTFNHLDIKDNESTQDVYFLYQNYEYVKATITVKRLEVERVRVIEYGEVNYTYGDKFNPEGFLLFIEHVNSPNRRVNLSLDMVDLEGGLVMPQNSGINELDFYFNGIKVENPVTIHVSKKDQSITNELIKLEKFDNNEIVVKEVANALYAFREEGGTAPLVWQEGNSFNHNTTKNYEVFLKLKSTETQNESNVVSKIFDYPGYPELVNTTETTAEFKYNSLYDLVLVDLNDIIIKDAFITIERGNYVVRNLLPNHNYRFALIPLDFEGDKAENITEIKTLEANNIITFNDQETTYNNEVAVFNYTVDQKYSNTINVSVKYYQNNIEVTPKNAGVYDVVVTNNFNNEVQTGSLTINKFALTVSQDDTYTYNSEQQDIKLSYNIFAGDDLTLTTKAINAGVTQAIITVDGNDQSNYSIPITVDVTIEKFELEVSQTKTYIYNSSEQEIEISSNMFDGDDLTLVAPATNAGVYVASLIAKGLDVGNYIIPETVFVTIDQLKVNLTVNDLSKVYGEDDPDLTFGIDVSNDYLEELNVSLERSGGEDVGFYEISVQSINDGNFNVVERTGLLTISKATLTITPNDNQSKVYGQADPVFAYTVSGYQFNDNNLITGLLTRETGEDTGLYEYTTGTLEVNSSNYELALRSNSFEITKLVLNVSQSAAHTYDSSEQSITLTSNMIANDDLELSAKATNAGTYEVALTATGAAKGNYIIPAVVEITIDKLSIDVLIDDKTKVYGEDDPSFTYTLGLNESYREELDIEIFRELGEDVDSYEIDVEKANLSNFTINVLKATLTITKKTLTITPNDNQSKVYGQADPVFTYAVSGYQFNDNNLITGLLTRETGEDVGLYEYTIGTLEVNSSNYEISFDNETFEITKLILNVSQSATHTYDSSEQSITLTSNMIANDNLELSAKATNAGTYEVALTAIGTDKDNYIIPAVVEITIDQLSIDVLIDDKTKVYGQDDPSFTYTLGLNESYREELDIEIFRELGEDVDNYEIDVEKANLSNFTINVLKATLTITKKTLTITPNDNQSKVYGQADPVFTYTVSGYQFNDNNLITGLLTRETGE